MSQEQHPLLPQYGIVIWRDAMGLRRKKVKAPVTRKDLPRRESVGRLFIAGDGTLSILHERDADARGVDRSCELTVVPIGWVEQVIPLSPGEPTVPPVNVVSPDDGSTRT